jgi:DNA-binding beta-propeller fold protein YncE
MHRQFTRKSTVLWILLSIGLIVAAAQRDAAAEALADVDLQLVSLTAPQSLIAGEAVGDGIVARIRNAGTQNIAMMFYVGFFVSADATITTDDTKFKVPSEGDIGYSGVPVFGLAAGAEIDVTLPGDLFIPPTGPSGNVFIGVLIDEFNAIAETNESNNSQANALQVVVDTDGDGVSDDVDLCPGENASNFDANGDGCIDEVASARHIEYWDNSDFPLVYVINQDGAPGISDGSDITEIQNGIATWTSIPGADVSVSYGGTTSQQDAQALDGVNLVSFADPDYKFPAGVIAVGLSTSFTTPTLFNNELVRPGKIVDADMIFNPTKTFSTPSAGSGTDIRSVTVHEAGHLFGISHSAVKTSTMFYVLPQATQASSLEMEDRLMLLKAYPTSATLSSASRLRGTVTDGLTSDPVPGAIVFAIDAATEDTMGCDYTRPGDGSYEFLGLPDGNYFVAIHALDGTSPIGFLQPVNINSIILGTAQTDFDPEYWDAAESQDDDPAAKDAVSVAAVATATADLVTNIDDDPPFVTSTLPDSNSTNVPFNGSILISFSEPIDSGTLQGNFSLLDSVTQTGVGGNAAILNDDSLIAFIPAGGLQFSTTYKLRLRTGLKDQAGNGLAAPFVMYFRTEPQPPVGIANLAPSKGVIGATVVINGFGFDPLESSNTVTFNGASATVLDAEPSALVVRVPSGATTGPVNVTTAAGNASYPGFAVLSSEEVPRGVQLGVANLGALPRSLVVSPDGAQAFVATDLGVSAVSVDPGAGNFLSVSSAAVTGGLNELDITPDGGRLYGISRTSEKLFRIDTTPGAISVLNEMSTGEEPLGVIIEPTGTRALVPAADGTIQIWDISVGSPTFEHQIGTIESPDFNLRGKMAIDPAGDHLLALSGTGKLLVFDLGPDTLLTEVPVGPDPRDVAVDPIGERAYVTDETGSVIVVSLSGFFNVQSIATGGTLRGLAITPAGSFVHAANRQLNFLDVVDLREGSSTFRSVVTTIPQPVNPVDVDLSPDGFYAVSISEAQQQLVVTAVGIGPALLSLSRVAGPVGAKVVLAGSGFTDGDATAVSFNGVQTNPERLSDDAITVSVPVGATSGPVSVALTSGGGPALVSNPIFFDVLDPTPVSAQHLRLSAGFPSVPNPDLADGGAVVAESPTGNFISSADADGGVHLLDTDPSSPTFHQYFGSIDVTNDASDLAITPDGDRLFVVVPDARMVEVFHSNRLSQDFLSSAGTIDLTSKGGSPQRVSVSPDGMTAIVTDPSLDAVYVVDIDSESPQAYDVVREHSLDGGVRETAFHPGGAFAYMPTVLLSTAVVYVLDTDRESASFGDVVQSLILPGPEPQESPIDLSFTPDGSRCLLLTSQLSGPSNRSVMMLDSTNPVSPSVTSSRSFGGSSDPTVEHIDVSPRGDRAIFNIRGSGFYNLQILTDPDTLDLIETAGDVFHHLTRMDNEYAVDASRFYTVSEFRDSMFVYDFTSAETIVLVSGNAQAGVVNQPLGAPLRVRVTSAGAVPVDGVPVVFNVTAGGGVLAGTGTATQTVATDPDGFAEVDWVLGPAVGAGAHSVVAAATGLSGAPVVFSADGVDDPNLLPLAVSQVVPTNGATGVNITTAMQTTFSRAVDPSSVTASTFFVHSGDMVPIPAVIGFSSANHKTSITPISPLAPNTMYTIEMTAGIKDASAGALSAPVSSSFTTAASPLLAVESISPPSGTVGITAVISGAGFQAVPSQNQVFFNAVPATVTSASNDFLNVTVPVGATSGPVNVVVGPDTSNAVDFVVLNAGSSVIEDEVIGNISTGTATKGIGITPDGALAYAVSPEADVVIPIDFQNLTAEPGIPVGDSPVAIVINPEGTLAYIANSAGGTVSVLDVDPASASFQHVVETIPVGTTPIDVAINPDGDRLFVVNGGSGDLSVVDTDKTSETQNQVLANLQTGNSAKSVGITPDGTLIYVGTDKGYEVLDAIGYSVLATINTGSSTKSVGITPDGAFLIILTASGNVDIYDIVPGSASENQVLGQISTGTTTKGVGISPDGALLYLVQEENDVILVVELGVLNSVGVRDKAAELPPAAIQIAVLDTITAGEDPSDVVFDPRGSGVVLVTNAGDATVSVFDPARSTTPIVADIEVNPRTLNLKTKGRYVEGRIELPSPYSAHDIAVNTVVLQDVVPAELSGFSFEDRDADGLEELLVKFDRALFQSVVPQGDAVPVHITGHVLQRTFVGEDTIRVIRPTLTYPNGDEMLAVNQSVTVTWDSPPDVAIDAVDVHWTPNDGADWYPIAEKISDHGSAAWTVPLEVGANCRVLVTLYENGVDVGAGISAESFTVEAPVAVTLGAFDISAGARGPVLRWETSFEYQVKGFHVLRCENETGAYERITTELVPSKGEVGGAAYEFTDEQALLNRTYYYKLEEVSDGDSGQLFGPYEITYRAPFALEQNAPNPFNPTTKIRFTVPEDARVSLVIYDVAGRRVRTLIDESRPANHYEIEWDGKDSAGQVVASGIYFYRLDAGRHSKTKKMLMMK